MKCPKCQHENPPESAYCGKCATPLRPNVTETLQTPIHELTTGQTFAGRYQIIEELGHGGMGRVYKVHDTKVGEKIALKLIRPEVASDKDTIERFSNELRLARRIGHRNVCKMFDIGEAAGARFITMEYVHGEDLKSMIHMSGSLSLGMLLSVAKQVCEGLAEAHGLGVVHRDLKPQNIMIDKNGNAKIMDFGIARSVREKGITGPSVMIGTPEYMSPEQAEAKDVNHRSDIYSLGVILYEMATSRVPFEGETALSVAMKHKGEAPRPPKELNPGLPDDLSGVILKCLEKDKAKRYQSASDVRSELERIEKGLPTTEKILPSARSTSRQITVSFSPKKIIVPGLIGLAVVAAGIVILSVLPRKRIATPASARPTVAVVNFENKTGDKALDNWSTGIRDLLIMDLNQSRFLDVLTDSDIYGVLKKLDLADASAYSTADLVRIADEGGAQYTVNGSFLKAGDQIVINATCRKPHSREGLSPVQVAGGNFDEIMPKIREITRKIKADLNLTATQLAADVDQSIGDIASPSAEAWAYYVESRRHHFRIEYADAIRLLRKAVAIDPEFIMAYWALRSASQNILDYPEARKYEAKALELIQNRPERISEKDRNVIELEHYYWNRPEPDWAKSLEAGRKNLALYPDHPRINYTMACIFGDIEEWDEALKHYEKCISTKFRFGAAYSQIADVYRAINMPDKAQEVLEKYLREIENNAFGRRELAYLHLGQNRLDLAAKELEAAETLAPDDYSNRVLRASWLVRKGDLAEAEAAYRALVGEKTPAARYSGYRGLGNLLILEGRDRELIKIVAPLAEQFKKSGLPDLERTCHESLARAYLISGRTEAARNECRKAFAIDTGNTDFGNKRSVIHLRGLIHLASNRIDEAEITAGELKAFIEKGLNKKAIRLYDHLMGAIELKRKNFSRAVEYLERAERSLPYGRYEKAAWILDTLALTYFSSGDLEKAREKYEHITALTTGRLSYGDIYARAFYRLGQIHEKLGDKAKARENYAKFLELWKDADPGFSEVEDARKRLEVLGK
ncbi:MAG TPA: serine/threonine-protein kinase [Candidatus Aminicenantes bacterium]|nr:serine/threonine-protein kinase [Candidatus Aminicenantes bacterium]